MRSNELEFTHFLTIPCLYRRRQARGGEDPRPDRGQHRGDRGGVEGAQHPLDPPLRAPFRRDLSQEGSHHIVVSVITFF